MSSIKISHAHNHDYKPHDDALTHPLHYAHKTKVFKYSKESQ